MVEAVLICTQYMCIVYNVLDESLEGVAKVMKKL